MWQRFTERARRIVFFAQEEAGRLDDDMVAPEHLLLGLIRESDSAAGRVFNELGISRKQIKLDVEREIPKGRGNPGRDMQLTPRAKRVIDLSYDEARNLHHNYIGSEHLLLGLVREDDGLSAKVLQKAGVDLEKVRRLVLESAPSGDTEGRPGGQGMYLRDLIHWNRSYRRFLESEPISMDALRSFVQLARLSPSAGNLQPLKYMLSNDPDKNARIFQTLAWAGYLKNWAGPAEGERPSAYIILLLDTQIKKGAGCDHGIAAQSILLGAVDAGYGGCMVGAIDRDALRANLSIPEQYEILLVLALGRPAETVLVEDVGPEGDIKYYRDEKDIHHVPKRKLDDLIVDF